MVDVRYRKKLSATEAISLFAKVEDLDGLINMLISEKNRLEAEKRFLGNRQHGQNYGVCLTPDKCVILDQTWLIKFTPCL